MTERKAKRIRAEPAPTAALSAASPPQEPKDSVSSFLQSWAWKREHRPDRDRFQRPYVHSLRLPGAVDAGRDGGGGVAKLTVEQARFRGAQGFASTVWDSSIVVSKMLERNPDLVAGRAVLDLSAGCGLVALVAARLGACRTVATDLGPNLPLLRRNCERNGAAVEVMEHWWGSDVTTLLLARGSGTEEAEATTATSAAAEAGAGAAGGGEGAAGRLDVVIACDVMYQQEVVAPLVATLAALCGGSYKPVATDDEDGGGGGGGTTEASPPGQQRRQSQSPAAVAATASPPAARPAATTTTAPAAADGNDGDGDAPLADSGVPGGCGEPPSDAPPAAQAAASATKPRPENPVSKPVVHVKVTPKPHPNPNPTMVILAHGRNRFAEASFWRHAAAAGFRSEAVPWDELDPVYRCTDVDVYRLRLEGGR